MTALADVHGVIVECPDGWKAVIRWRWPSGVLGGGSAVSPIYPTRSHANGWLSRAYVLAGDGICPYGLDKPPLPPRALPPPEDRSDAWAQIAQRAKDRLAEGLARIAERDAKLPAWIVRLEGLDGHYGWAGPHGETDGSGDREHMRTGIIIHRCGTWTTPGAVGGGNSGDPPLMIGYTRRRVAKEWS
jgi:hypothetical protein